MIIIERLNSYERQKTKNKNDSYWVLCCHLNVSCNRNKLQDQNPICLIKRTIGVTVRWYEISITMI